MVHALALDGAARVLAVAGEGPVKEVCERHGLQGFGARLAAEGTLATLLLAAHVKGDERLMLQIQGSVPRFAFTGEVRADGAIRARLTPADLRPSDRVEGTCMATKWEGRRELYRGVSELQGGSLETALTTYLRTSQQTQGLVRIQARLGEDGEVRFASGLLVERLPDTLAPSAFEARIAPLRDSDLAEVMTSFAFGQLLGEPVEVVGSVDVRHACTCSIERVESTLLALGSEDLRQLHEEQGFAEVTCHFCNERYVVPGPRLLDLAG